MKSKIITQAEIPSELEQAWLQHLRDFDAAHPGCHFQVLMDSPEQSIEEMEAKFRAVRPTFRFLKVYHQSKR